MSRQELRKLADFREMAEAHLERLGRAIQARRKELGWSRARLGREVSAHEKTVERWEKAKTAGALDNLEQIATALDMEADDLLSKAMPERRNGSTPDVLGELSSRSQLDRIEDKLTVALQLLRKSADQTEAELAAALDQARADRVARLSEEPAADEAEEPPRMPETPRRTSRASKSV